jgi:hypothetical protein
LADSQAKSAGDIPERTGEPPEPSKEQAKFICGWSLWNFTRPRSTKMRFIPPKAVYFVQVTLYTLAALALFSWNTIVWDFRRYAEEAPRGFTKPPEEVLLYVTFTLLFIFLVAHWMLTGRKARAERWKRWQWSSYENFRDEEDRLQVLGFLRLIIGALFISIGIASLLA